MPKGSDSLRRGIFVSVISSVIILFDYITKWILVETVHLHDHIELLPFLRIVHVENKGAAFGLFTYFGNNFFILISACAIICIAIYIIRLPIGLEVYSLSLILGGAAGNLIDRIRIGKVIDFIDIYVGNWHWPAFNVADSALTVGIVLFLISSLKTGHHSKRT